MHDDHQHPPPFDVLLTAVSEPSVIEHTLTCVQGSCYVFAEGLGHSQCIQAWYFC
jgi:hypothetical protein